MTKIIKDGKSKDFVCECGGNELEEVITEAVCVSVIEAIGEGGDCEYSSPEIEEGEISHFICISCDKVYNFNSTEDLYNFLIGN